MLFGLVFAQLPDRIKAPQAEQQPLSAREHIAPQPRLRSPRGSVFSRGTADSLSLASLGIVDSLGNIA